MDSFTHFSHEHSLHLLKQKPTETEKCCYACEVRLNVEKEHLVEVYGCDLCEDFFLHKYCAQLPMEIVHKSHKRHSLFLVLKPPGSHLEIRCQCKPTTCPLGFKYHHRFFYYCYVCHFLLGTDCALRKKNGIVWRNKELIFHHPSHKQHPLMVLRRPMSLLCDACGDKGSEDLSYHCLPCNYSIHKRCAMLPSTTTHHIHPHPLTLSFIGLPSHYRNDFYYDCDICTDRLPNYRNEYWVYYCDLCRYFVHIRCMEEKKPQMRAGYKGPINEDVPHLPMVDKSEELIRRFILKNNTLEDIQPEISIFSHKHPLVYSNDQSLEDGEEILCDACVEPIFSPPYYHCAECEYFLHLTCANLPRQLQLPIHSHQLSLGSKTRFDETFQCNRCERDSNGFFFYCTTEGCEFYLDLSCAALPKVIMHEYHNHPLVSRQRVKVPFSLSESRYRYKNCRGCGWEIWRSHWIGCTSCRFNLHMECILLPKTGEHRCDSKHPLILKFPPHAYHPNPFVCYQCEKEIDPYYWLYHCEECDLSFHVKCFNSAWRSDCNMKFGQKVQIDSHSHPLKFVYEASVSSSRCHNKCEGDDSHYTLECETCNFRLCKFCVKEIEL